MDTSGVRQDLADVQREADANPLELATRGGGGGSGTFSGEARSRLAPGVATVNPASALYNRLPSESVVVSSAAGAAPYLVGPAGWQGGVNPNTPAGIAAAAGASPQPYGLSGGFSPGSVPLYSPPAAGTLRTAAPYDLASTLPPWAARREAENFGGPDTDLGDVEALGRGVEVADEGGRPSRRRGRGGYGGILAIHFGTHLASGIARYALRSQEIQSQLERGEDPQLDSLRAELEGFQSVESIPFLGQGYQIGEAITGRLDPKGYSKLGIQNRIQDIERERAEARFQTGLGAERLESRMTADNLRRQAWQEGLTGTDAARAAANVSLAEQQDRAYARRAGLVAAVNEAPNGDALDKATDGLSEFDRNRPAEAVAEVALRDARIKAVARGELDRGRSIIDRGGAGILRAQGRFGAAAEEDFEAGLRGRERDALRNDPNNANLVREENNIERQARVAGITEDVTRLSAANDASALLRSYDPTAAIGRRQEEDERRARAEAPTDAKRDELIRQAAERAAAAYGARADARFGIDARLGIEAAGLRQILDPAQSVAVGQSRERTSGIVGGALLQALGLAEQGFGHEADVSLSVGSQRLKAYGREYAAALQPTEVDPSRTAIFGGGTDDTQKIFADIAEGMKSLQNVGSDVQAIKEKIEKLGYTQ